MPSKLYRVQHRNSQTVYSRNLGFIAPALDRLGPTSLTPSLLPSLFPPAHPYPSADIARRCDEALMRKMTAALDWTSQQDSPFIQLYTDEAAAHRLAACLTSSVVWVISGMTLIETGEACTAWKVSELERNERNANGQALALGAMGVRRKGVASRLGEVVIVVGYVGIDAVLGTTRPAWDAPGRMGGDGGGGSSYGNGNGDLDEYARDEALLVEALEHF